MGFRITVKDFVTYFTEAHDWIASQKEYITDLDAATGDGDHWVNINKGLEKITSLSNVLVKMSLADMFKRVGMTMFTAVGGSSGALYGSGYMAASKMCTGKDYLDVSGLYDVYDAMLQEMMKRGKTKPGQKTMVDSLSEALIAYKEALDTNVDEDEIIERFIVGAVRGAENTKAMEAVKGRASYRKDKGVGCLDPGAVTMAMQLKCMGDYILKNKRR